MTDQDAWNTQLTKIRKLLGRRGVAVPYATLHRFAVAELGFGRGAATVAIVDGEPEGYLVHATMRAHKTKVVTADGTR